MSETYLSTAVDYMLLKCPFGDVLLQHAGVADIANRQTDRFSSLHFFMAHFPCVIPEGASVNLVEEEFRLYQATTVEQNLVNMWTEQAWREIRHNKKGSQSGLLPPFGCDAGNIGHIPLQSSLRTNIQS